MLKLVAFPVMAHLISWFQAVAVSTEAVVFAALGAHVAPVQGAGIVRLAQDLDPLHQRRVAAGPRAVARTGQRSAYWPWLQMVWWSDVQKAACSKQQALAH